MLLSLPILLLCHVFVAGRPATNFDELNANVTPFHQRRASPIRQKSELVTSETPRSQHRLLNGDDRTVYHYPRTGTNIVVGGHNASLGEYLWSGRTGEYWEVLGGWPGWEGDVVAKEFYIWYWPHELTREVKFLSRIGQLVAQDKYEGFQWLIMHKPPGVHLTKTGAFKEAYQKGTQECDHLVETVYEPAFNAITDYIRRYGIFHHVSNARMLWDDNATSVHLFDFGDDTERDPRAAEDPDVRNEVALNVYNAWMNNGISYQGWCVNGQGQ